MGLGSSSSSPDDKEAPEGMDKAALAQLELAKARVVVKQLIDCDKIVIFSKTACPFCKTAKSVSFIF
jgi:hypothetical protein